MALTFFVLARFSYKTASVSEKVSYTFIVLQKRETPKQDGSFLTEDFRLYKAKIGQKTEKSSC